MSQELKEVKALRKNVAQQWQRLESKKDKLIESGKQNSKQYKLLQEKAREKFNYLIALDNDIKFLSK